MKAYNKIKNLLFGSHYPQTPRSSGGVLVFQTENIVYLSPRETAFIYRQNKRITRTLTPDNPLKYATCFPFTQYNAPIESAPFTLFNTVCFYYRAIKGYFFAGGCVHAAKRKKTGPYTSPV